MDTSERIQQLKERQRQILMRHARLRAIDGVLLPILAIAVGFGFAGSVLGWVAAFLLCCIGMRDNLEPMSKDTGELIEIDIRLNELCRN